MRNFKAREKTEQNFLFFKKSLSFCEQVKMSIGDLWKGSDGRMLDGVDDKSLARTQ